MTRWQRSLPGWAVLAAALVVAGGCALVRRDDSAAPGGPPLPVPPAIVRAGELRVGLVAGRPPYLVVDPADPTGLGGLEVRLLKALATQAGLPLRPQAYASEDELFAGLRMGEVDLAVPAATDWTVLRHFHAPCAPHLATGQRYVVRRSVAAFLTRPEQLDRPQIAALAVVGTAGAEQAARQLPRARRETFPDLPSALDRLRAANDAVLVTDARTAHELAASPEAGLAVVFALCGGEQLCWAVRDTEEDLPWRRYLDRFMADLRASGQLEAWLAEAGCPELHADPAAPLPAPAAPAQP